jgi:hypothetical protein
LRVRRAPSSNFHRHLQSSTNEGGAQIVQRRNRSIEEEEEEEGIQAEISI